MNNNTGYIGLEIKESVNKNCFPLLSKYDCINKYISYTYRVNNIVDFVITNINNKIYFRIEISNITYLQKNKINEINKYLNKNISKYKINSN